MVRMPSIWLARGGACGRRPTTSTTHGLANARVEAVNNKIKLIVKMAYGFKNLDSLFSMVMLKCSDLQVELPGRST